MLNTMKIKKPLTHIGSKELIAFPEQDVFDVPAKVDTGADFSAVWASEIEENDGQLSYCLFGQGSKYYTGQPIRTRQYGLTRVKNSFGVSEERYKVKHSIVLGDRKIKVEFSLADRSNNKYPVLIGKRTLSKRFLVDVSLNNILKDAVPRVLILSSKPSPRIDGLVESINDADTKMRSDHATYDDLVISIDATTGITIEYLKTGEDLSVYDLIYFKTYFKKAELAATVAEYAQTNGITFMDREVAQYHAQTKLTQYAQLVRDGVNVPRTLFMGYLHLPGQFKRYKKYLGLPFVLKDIAAEQGEFNYLIHDETQFEKVATQAAKDQAYYVGQEFIKNDGDYRIIVLDKDVSLVIHRKQTDTISHLNNTSKGAVATRIEVADFPVAAQTTAVRAAMALERQVAGVDLIQDSTTGEWYVLEVNNSPQLAGGAYLEEKLEAFVALLRKQVDK